MTNEERQQAIEWLKCRPVMMAGAKRMYDLAVEALEAYVPDKQPEMTDEQFKDYCRKRCLSVVTNEFMEDVRKMVPTVQPTQTNCEYCHEDRDGYVMPLEKNGHAFITYSPIDGGFVLSIKYGSWRKNVPVKFCPVCGRRLT